MRLYAFSILRRAPLIAGIGVVVCAWIAVATPAIAAEFGIVGGFKLPRSQYPTLAPYRTMAVGVNHSGAGGVAPGQLYVTADRGSGQFGGPVDLWSFGADSAVTKVWTPSPRVDTLRETPGDNIDIDQSTGEIYVSGEGATHVYSAEGQFLRSFGWDVVASGPSDGNTDEVQQLKVVASGGTFTIRYPNRAGASPRTKPIPFDAPASAVQAALDELSYQPSPGETVQVDVSVSGGPGSPTGDTPYVITYGGEDAGDDLRQEGQFEIGQWAEKLTGPVTRVEQSTLADGGGPEVCTPVDICKAGVEESEFSGTGAGGMLPPRGMPVLPPPTAPNADNLIVAGSRVNEFTRSGQFLRAAGWDVVATGPGDSAVDEQKQISLSPNVAGGMFSLSFRSQTTGATGNGTWSKGVTELSQVSTSNGKFAVGQKLTGAGIAPETTIIGVGSGSLQLSQATSAAGAGAALVATDLPYNATSGEVAKALDDLPTIGGAGGSVGVSGPNGGPYIVTFHGALAGDRIIQSTGGAIQAFRGITDGLTTASGSPTVTVEERTAGGAFETCTPSLGDVCKPAVRGTAIGQRGEGGGGVAIDSSGAIYVLEERDEEVNSNVNRRVQKFTPVGTTFVPSLFGATEKQAVNVNASAGQFRLAYPERNGTTGSAEFSNSKTLKKVVIKKGEPRVGQRIFGFFVASGTKIDAVEGDTITLSKPPDIAVRCPACVPPVSGDFRTTRFVDTVDLAHDVPASGGVGEAASVENALNALAPIANEGTVSVSGGPGGTAPYEVRFDGGKLDTRDIFQLLGKDGTVPLSGGSGPGADEVTVTTETDGGPSGESPEDQAEDIAIDYADRIFLTRNNYAGVATCTETGQPSPAEQRIEEWTTAEAKVGESLPCMGLRTRATGGGFTRPDLIVDPISGEPYVMSAQLAPEETIIAIFGDVGSQPELTMNPPSDIGPRSARVSGTVTPHGPKTTGHPNPTATRYRVEYRQQGASDWIVYAPPTAIGTEDTPNPFSVGVSGLRPSTSYEIRVTAAKRGFAETVGPIQTITTDGAVPEVVSFSAGDVTASSAVLHARINPLGSPTTYHFEYGRTLAYGETTGELEVGSAAAPVDVEVPLNGLDPAPYYFRVIATNALGSTSSKTQSFNFYPTSCPNSAVRQQTGAGRLPDCRAYELVSPENAGTATIVPGGPSSGVASNPPRHGFIGYLGAIPGAGNPPNEVGSNYVATRSPTGWRTAYVGIPAEITTHSGGNPMESLNEDGEPNFGEAIFGPLFADRALDRTLMWDQGRPFFAPGNDKGEFAPYLYDANGHYQGRLPTNADDVPGGLQDSTEGGFVGASLPSPDFDHYFFSSANVAFAPGGLTSEGGSVYDNDLHSGSVTIASRLPAGGDIPREPGNLSDDFKLLPGSSTDGSRILIASTGVGVCGQALCKPPAAELCANQSEGRCLRNQPAHLYMRVDGSVTYDVSRGHVVKYVGMTADASKVYFTSSAQITGDDDDQSNDLYMWREQGDTLTRVSSGQGVVGDTDNCNASWVQGCGIANVKLNGGTFGTLKETESVASFAPPTDNSIASDTGDIYFYSPEQFSGADGIPGRRNLYVYRDDRVQYVATLDSANPLVRIQVSRDGRYAALLTATQLTAYDNTSPKGGCSYVEGKAFTGPRCLEMYLYDADLDELTCVSCPGLNDPPAGDVRGSQNGLFMTDDGRVFFDTTNALDPQDTNGIIDTYEFVEGRAQLITSGTGETESSQLIGRAGLVGVSADGMDVYISTFEALVPQDHNAKYLRIYDARTNGGFFVAPGSAPCQAAEECRDPGSSALPTPSLTSTASLGQGGNAITVPKARKGRKKRGNRQKKRAGKHKRRSRGSSRGASR